MLGIVLLALIAHRPSAPLCATGTLGHVHSSESSVVIASVCCPAACDTCGGVSCWTQSGGLACCAAHVHGLGAPVCVLPDDIGCVLPAPAVPSLPAATREAGCEDAPLARPAPTDTTADRTVEDEWRHRSCAFKVQWDQCTRFYADCPCSCGYCAPMRGSCAPGGEDDEPEGGGHGGGGGDSGGGGDGGGYDGGDGVREYEYEYGGEEQYAYGAADGEGGERERGSLRRVPRQHVFSSSSWLDSFSGVVGALLVLALALGPIFAGLLLVGCIRASGPKREGEPCEEEGGEGGEGEEEDGDEECGRDVFDLASRFASSLLGIVLGAGRAGRGGGGRRGRGGGEYAAVGRHSLSPHAPSSAAGSEYRACSGSAMGAAQWQHSPADGHGEHGAPMGEPRRRQQTSSRNLNSAFQGGRTAKEGRAHAEVPADPEVAAEPGFENCSESQIGISRQI